MGNINKNCEHYWVNSGMRIQGSRLMTCVCCGECEQGDFQEKKAPTAKILEKLEERRKWAENGMMIYSEDVERRKEYQTRLEEIENVIHNLNIECMNTALPETAQKLNTDEQKTRKFLLGLLSVGGSASQFEEDIFTLINAYIKEGLSKPDLVRKMKWITGSCEMS